MMQYRASYKCKQLCVFQHYFLSKRQGAIAKWLRRQIRNLFLFEGAGSNPAGVGQVFLFFSFVVDVRS